MKLSPGIHRSCSRSTCSTVGDLWYVGSGILTAAGGLTSALSQGNNTQKLDGGCCGLAGDRHRSTTCGDAVRAWIAVAEGPQLVQICTQRSTAQDCALLAQPPCWAWRLWVIVCWYNCGVARGCCGLDALGSFEVWSICEKSLCFSAFSNRQAFHIGEGTVCPNSVFWFLVQHSDVQSQAEQFC